jgi:peptide deformylase
MVDGYIRGLAAELLEMLQELNSPSPRAYGIAAPQVGELVQLFVISSAAIQIIVLNPVITKTFGQHTWIEGCLSLPGYFYKVTRPKLIKFQYLGLDGAMHAEKAHDDYSGIFEHEIQHLSGICIDDIGMPVSREAIFSH